MAAKGFSGINIVLKNLNKAIAEIEGGTRAGMRKATLLIRRKSVEITPIDTGNLRGSAFTEVFEDKSNNKISGVIGYTAAYAPFVHEIPKNYNEGVVGFLRKALMENQDKVLDLIKEGATIK